ncbi:ACT domain-containing protein [Microbulbifer sp. VAAF005]|uniref:ACT domain-containing protein n=1 Tax=Microbulbifer sp. VAAF005 TaxID=3034230 RepID=UPI0024ACA161|nr:ACT domain-containing protein [Microbulbifer sp. VAAF005]WHI46924.1 ACT domain-containing protein [Microbulbifer sp. VAAF005]
MSGTVDLGKLLDDMNPQLFESEYVFCHVSGQLSDYVHLQPRASFIEPEGLTLILLKSIAENENIRFESTYKQIMLTVHSSLNAVGLTAVIPNKLMSKGISANVVAAYFHDHIFVQSEKAKAALSALYEISGKNS